MLHRGHCTPRPDARIATNERPYWGHGVTSGRGTVTRDPKSRLIALRSPSALRGSQGYAVFEKI